MKKLFHKEKRIFVAIIFVIMCIIASVVQYMYSQRSNTENDIVFDIHKETNDPQELEYLRKQKEHMTLEEQKIAALIGVGWFNVRKKYILARSGEWWISNIDAIQLEKDIKEKVKNIDNESIQALIKKTIEDINFINKTQINNQGTALPAHIIYEGMQFKMILWETLSDVLQERIGKNPPKDDEDMQDIGEIE